MALLTKTQLKLVAIEKNLKKAQDTYEYTIQIAANAYADAKRKAKKRYTTYIAKANTYGYRTSAFWDETFCKYFEKAKTAEYATLTKAKNMCNKKKLHAQRVFDAREKKAQKKYNKIKQQYI